LAACRGSNVTALPNASTTKWSSSIVKAYGFRNFQNYTLRVKVFLEISLGSGLAPAVGEEPVGSQNLGSPAWIRTTILRMINRINNLLISLAQETHRNRQIALLCTVCVRSILPLAPQSFHPLRLRRACGGGDTQVPFRCQQESAGGSSFAPELFGHAERRTIHGLH